jgi:hypothetical protein
MTTEMIIIQIFCYVDDRMSDIEKHPQAKLYPSELVTIGILFALKGSHFRAFYRWLSRDGDDLFSELPDRTRLQRALKVHQDWCDRLLVEPTFFTFADSYPTWAFGMPMACRLISSPAPQALGMSASLSKPPFPCSPLCAMPKSCFIVCPTICGLIALILPPCSMCSSLLFRQLFPNDQGNRSIAEFSL